MKKQEWAVDDLIKAPVLKVLSSVSRKSRFMYVLHVSAHKVWQMSLEAVRYPLATALASSHNPLANEMRIRLFNLPGRQWIDLPFAADRQQAPAELPWL